MTLASRTRARVFVYPYPSKNRCWRLCVISSHIFLYQFLSFFLYRFPCTSSMYRCPICSSFCTYNCACTHLYIFIPQSHNPASRFVSPHYLYHLYSLSFVFPVLVMYPALAFGVFFHRKLCALLTSIQPPVLSPPAPTLPHSLPFPLPLSTLFCSWKIVIINHKG